MSWSAAPDVVEEPDLVEEPDPAEEAGVVDVESTPAVAHRLFGEGLVAAERFATLLTGPGALRGVIGPREAGRIWTRHLLNCAVVAELIPLGAAVVDLGSGAGLPGIVLALARPDLQVALVEPMARRTDFLTEVVDELDLAGRVSVCRSRAQDHAPMPAPAYDVVVVRAVTDLSTLCTWARPLLRPGGTLLAMKGSRADDEIAAARPGLTAAGGHASKHVLGATDLDEPTTVVSVGWGR